jgi:3-oxoacyl-[acyl-carrier protein] reductase
MSTDRLDTINVGDEAEIVHTISEADVDAFSRLTGDDNPLHMDEAFAASTSFQKRVVHGMLTASFISTIIGTRLPGPGAMWFEQTTQFLSPVRIGERIRVRARVRHKSVAQRIVVLETVVFGDDGRKVIEGEAKVKIIQQETQAPQPSSAARKAVIISGAGRGIGAAIARQLAGAGHPVLINYLRDDEQANRVKRQIESQGGAAMVYKADVADEAEVRRMTQLAIETYGGLSGVVNNACGAILPHEFLELAWADVQRHLEVQLRGAFNLAQAALPNLLEQKGGVIVNIASVYADAVPPVKIIPYVAAKSALVGLSKSLAAEFGPQGIRVNTVSPGMTRSDFISNVPEKTKLATKMQTPLRRLAEVEDVAGTVRFLFSDAASFISGQNIRVCGGAVMQ